MITREKNLIVLKTTVLLLLSITAITLCGIIYLIIRPTELFFLDWKNSWVLENQLTKLYILDFLVNIIIPERMFFLLWIFPYSAVIDRIWLRNQYKLKGDIISFLQFRLFFLDKLKEDDDNFHNKDHSSDPVFFDYGHVILYDGLKCAITKADNSSEL